MHMGDRWGKTDLKFQGEGVEWGWGLGAVGVGKF